MSLVLYDGGPILEMSVMSPQPVMQFYIRALIAPDHLRDFPGIGPGTHPTTGMFCCRRDVLKSTSEMTLATQAIRSRSSNIFYWICKSYEKKKYSTNLRGKIGPRVELIQLPSGRDAKTRSLTLVVTSWGRQARARSLLLLQISTEPLLRAPHVSAEGK